MQNDARWMAKSADTNDRWMFGLELHISSARSASWKSASAVDFWLSGRIRDTHWVEG